MNTGARIEAAYSGHIAAPAVAFPMRRLLAGTKILSAPLARAAADEVDVLLRHHTGRDLIARTLGIDRSRVSGTSDMSNTTKWDSLRQILLMTELGTRYGIGLSDQEMLGVVSI